MLQSTASVEEILKIVYTEHRDPFSVLGAHILMNGKQRDVAIRAFLPLAQEAFVVYQHGKQERTAELLRIHPEGFFEKVFPRRKNIFSYKLRTIDANGNVAEFHDSYAFLPTLTEYDLFLFGEGNHYKIYDKLGAHFAEIDGVGGIQFAVWAPAARCVSVIGSFNNWDRRIHAMRMLGSSGVWEIFIPGLMEGELYKYEIKTYQGHVLDKTDPFARSMEVRPRTASVINTMKHFSWRDQDWIAERASSEALSQPISIYEVHLASWRRRAEDGNRHLSYRELADELIPYVLSLGFTHIELLPVMEYPYDGSWGYQVTGYYAPTSRFGSPQDFMFFIDECHRNKLGVILDWVPAHFPTDIHALNYFDGTHLFEHADPRKGFHQDWGTLIFNYGRNEVRNFLIANALYWIEKFHIDGLRIDAVAAMLYLDYSRDAGEWEPNEFGGRENLDAINFLRQLNNAIHLNHPGVLVMAEESTTFTGVTHPIDMDGLGFDLKWNMGWMHDTLDYFAKDPIHRKFHHNNLTFSLEYAFSEKFLLPLSHDEVVHLKKSIIGKMPGDYWQQFASVRALYGYMFGHPGKKLLFMGGDFGQWTEWNHDDQLDWALLEFDAHGGLQRFVRDLNQLYKNETAMHEDDFSWNGFQWIDVDNAEMSLLAFERKSKRTDDRLIFVCNFTPLVHEQYRLGVPESGMYHEVLNSDAVVYGGSGVVNMGSFASENMEVRDHPFAITMRVPPLGVAIFKREAGPEAI